MNIKCQNCGRSYPSTIAISSSNNVVMSGNQQNCPYCNKINTLPEGKFSFDKYGKATLIKTIEELNLSESQIKHIGSLAQQAKNEDISFDQFKEEIAKISPQAISIIPKSVSTRKAFLTFVAMLLIAISYIIGRSSSNGKEQNNNPTDTTIVNKRITKTKSRKEKLRNESDSEWNKATKRHRHFLDSQRKKK